MKNKNYDLTKFGDRSVLAFDIEHASICDRDVNINNICTFYGRTKILKFDISFLRKKTIKIPLCNIGYILHRGFDYGKTQSFAILECFTNLKYIKERIYDNHEPESRSEQYDEIDYANQFTFKDNEEKENNLEIINEYLKKQFIWKNKYDSISGRIKNFDIIFKYKTKKFPSILFVGYADTQCGKILIKHSDIQNYAALKETKGYEPWRLESSILSYTINKNADMNKKHEYRVGIIYYSRGILISKRRINVFKYLETGKNIELNIQKTIDVVNKYLNDGVFCNFSSKEIKVLAWMLPYILDIHSE